MLAVDCRSGSPSNQRRLAFRNAPQQSWARLNFLVRRGMRPVAVDQSQFAKKRTPKRMRGAGNYIRFVPFFRSRTSASLSACEVSSTYSPLPRHTEVLKEVFAVVQAHVAHQMVVLPESFAGAQE